MEIYEGEFPLGKESMELIEYILCKFEASCKEEEKNQWVKPQPVGEYMYEKWNTEAIIITRKV